MFKNFEIINYINYYEYSGHGIKYSYTAFTIKIIDDDFEEIVTVSIKNRHDGAAVVIAFSEFYLPTDKLFCDNLILLYLKIKEKCKFSEYYLLDNFISNFPEFKKYKEELEQILLFS